jgi:hypothetical protein
MGPVALTQALPMSRRVWLSGWSALNRHSSSASPAQTLTARSGHDGNVYNWNDRRTGNCVAGAQGKASSSQAKLPSVQRPQASGIDQPAWND